MKHKLLLHLIACIALGWVLYLFVIPNFVNNPDITIKLRIRSNQQDSYRLYYSNNGVYDESRTITVDGKETSNWQTLLFEIPDSSNLAQFRIDFGEKNTSSTIEIDYLKISYRESSIIIPKEIMGELFDFNEYCDYHPESGTLNTKIIQGAYFPHDPYMLSKPIKYLLSTFSKSFSYKSLCISFLIALAVFINLTIANNNLSVKKIFNAMFMLLFLLILTSPTIFAGINKQEEVNLENRIKATRPTFTAKSWEEYPKLFESYLNDNFGFRQFFVNSNAQFRYLFLSSIKPDRVLIGKDGWFFQYETFDATDDGIHDVTHTNLLSEDAIKEWVNFLESRADSLKKMSIEHYKLVGPNTSTIYPEFLPNRILLSTPYRDSRFDQIKNMVKKTNSHLNLVDVRPALFEQKKNYLLYRKKDSHWNRIAGYFAYREFILKLGNQTPRNIDDFYITEEQAMLGLSNAASLSKYSFADNGETDPVLMLKNDISVRGLSFEIFHNHQTAISECDSAISDKTLLLFRDSFGNEIMPYLASHFKKCVFIWTDFNRDSVFKYHPDIVLECNVERRFLR